MLANNILRQLFAQLIGLISGLITSVITARILGPEGRGEFSLLLNTASLLSFILGFGFGNGIIHALSSHKMGDRRVINSFLVLINGLILISAIIIYVFPKQYFHLFIPTNHDSSYYQIILFVLFFLAIFNSFYTSVLSGKKIFKQQQFVFGVVSVFSILFYIVLFSFKQENNIYLLTFLLFYVIITSVPVIGLFFAYFKYAKSEFNYEFLNIQQLKYLFTFSFLAYLGGILHFLSCRMDFWFVEYYNGSKNLGYYSLASNLSQMLWIVPQAISSILISYSALDDVKNSIKNTNSLIRITLSILAIGAIVLVFCIGFIIPALFGNEYYDSIYLFKLLLIGIVPFSITTILASFFIGIGKIKVNLMISFISFALGLIFDLFLIPKYGVVGAAYASILSYVISTIFIAWIYLKNTNSTLSELIILKRQDINLIKLKIKPLG